MICIYPIEKNKIDMGRYLIFFSYIGTHYRGLQIQRHAGEVITRFKTVQGVLEEHLQKLKPANEVKVKTSSRTDSNVHALCNTCHVDLVHRFHPEEFNPRWITSTLNKLLTKSNEKLRILNTVLVHDGFSSRMEASERSYVYRLAVVKKKNVFTDPSCRGLPWTAQDAEHCSRVYAPFDMEQFLKAAEILSGTHKFLSFSTKHFLKAGPKVIPDTQLSIRVQRSSATMDEHRHGVSELMDFWDVHFHGRSFLYKQVRRMMGAMVAVAQGEMTTQQLQHFLDHPSLNNPGRIHALTGHGLTLKEVHYPQHVFNYNPPVVPAEEQVDNGLHPEVKSLLKETAHAPAAITALTASSSLTVTSPSLSSPLSAVTAASIFDSGDSARACTEDAKWVTNGENSSTGDCAADFENCATSHAECATDLENCTTSDVECATDLENCTTSDVECATDLKNCTTSDVECATDLENCATSDAECATDLKNCTTSDAECATDLKNCTTNDAECATDLENCTTSEVECATDLKNCATSEVECATDLKNCATSDVECATDLEKLRNQ